MREPHNLPMLVVLLFLLIGIIPMKLQLGSHIELQKHLHFPLKPLSYDSTLSRFSKLSTEIYLFVKLDFGWDFGLVLVARFDRKMFFLWTQHQSIPDLFLFELLHGQTQVLVGYFMAKIDGLVILDRHVELQIVALYLYKKQCVLKLAKCGLAWEVGFAFWVSKRYWWETWWLGSTFPVRSSGRAQLSSR